METAVKEKSNACILSVLGTIHKKQGEIKATIYSTQDSR